MDSHAHFGRLLARIGDAQFGQNRCARASPVEGVGALVEMEARLFLGTGAAAQRSGLFIDNHRLTGAGQVEGRGHPGQSATGYDNGKLFVIGLHRKSPAVACALSASASAQ